MLKLTSEENDLLAGLGLRLRMARVARRMTQEEMGARAGVSRQTVVAMERGDAAVGMGKWLKVSSLLGLGDTWQTVLALPADPFDEYDRRLRDEEKIRRTRVRPK